MLSDRDLLVAANIFMDSWKYYLLWRNRWAIEEMKEIPPELVGFMTEHDYKVMRRTSKNHTISTMFVIIVSLGWRLAKLLLGYYPALWQLTKDYGDTVTLRAVWFFAFDVFVNQAVEKAAILVITFLSPSGLTNADPLLSLIEAILEMTAPALLSGLVGLILIEMTNKYGAKTFLHLTILSNVCSILAVMLYVGYFVPLVAQPLQDDETGRSVKSLAVRVGYPPNKIYIDPDEEAKPNAYFAGLLGTKMIMISRSLMSLLDPPHIASVVAHELGHWNYGHSTAHFSLAVLIGGGFSCMTMKSYDNRRINELFNMANGTLHPIVPVYLAIHFIWPLLQDCANGVLSLLGRWYEFSADDFSCSQGMSNSLREALLTMEAKTKNLPIYDGWFSTWFLGHPTILERVRRIDRRERG